MEQKAKVLPGQVTIEDVEREAEKEKETWENSVIEIRTPGEAARVIRTRSYCLSYIDEYNQTGRNTSSFADGLDAIACYVIMRKNIAQLRQVFSEEIALLEKNEEIGPWLDKPPALEDNEEADE